jgi:hypothetical protein
MLPAIAEVVEVSKRLGAGVLEHVDQPGLAGVERTASEVGIGQPPAHVAARAS